MENPIEDIMKAIQKRYDDCMDGDGLDDYNNGFLAGLIIAKNICKEHNVVPIDVDKLIDQIEGLQVELDWYKNKNIDKAPSEEWIRRDNDGDIIGLKSESEEWRCATFSKGKMSKCPDFIGEKGEREVVEMLLWRDEWSKDNNMLVYWYHKNWVIYITRIEEYKSE